MPMSSSRTRPTWDDFFIQQLPALARRATCDRGRSAAIFVRDNDQLAAGYVGSPPGMPHCDDVGHLWDATKTHCLRTIHAEQNAMLRALRHGISLRDTTVYCTMVPCFTCAKLMVGVGVYRVVALHSYHDDAHTRDLFADASIALVVMTDAQLYQPRSPELPIIEADAPTSESCSSCGSNQWVSVSLDGGWSRRAQCVPCGTIRPGIIGPGWQAGFRACERYQSDDNDDDVDKNDLICPVHHIPFKSIAKSPNGPRTCTYGETWVVGRSGIMVNTTELEAG